MLDGHFARLRMTEAWALHDADTFRSFVETVRSFGVDPFKARILDVGCGPNAPMSVMLSAAGATVTGLDHRIVPRWGLGFRPARYLAYCRQAGFAKTIRKAFGEAVYDRRYYAALAERTRLRLSDDKLDLRELDITDPALADGSVDLVHSNATWEHVLDVGGANRQIARVLRPGGLAYIEIHLFPSLSGGHDLPWIVPGKTELGAVRPWQHLRDPSWKPPVVLNRLRERDYDRLFRSTPGLEVVDWRTEYTEGHELLTDVIRGELPDYSDEELTRRSIIVVARRR